MHIQDNISDGLVVYPGMQPPRSQRFVPELVCERDVFTTCMAGLLEVQEVIC